MRIPTDPSRLQATSRLVCLGDGGRTWGVPQIGDRVLSIRSLPAAIELSDEPIELERAAWADQQEKRLTMETAARVQAAIIAHAEATDQNRYDVERELPRVVMHPGPDGD
ncbi:hypothetical protein ACWD7C_12910 [Streptomyces sp. NPDC005134]|uniref:hypothetical protein n=1 Tax=unclassified Streptomyces TaxID=2593676 RepID=UPI0033A2A62B